MKKIIKKTKCLRCNSGSTSPTYIPELRDQFL